ncbi:MAG: HAMP domain-containing histidine kinase [Deltaproteobacteria bacterium]|nr:HAMP domain-containing histidine kinase [Deltaproteobacteria bacterium]
MSAASPYRKTAPTGLLGRARQIADTSDRWFVTVAGGLSNVVRKYNPATLVRKESAPASRRPPARSLVVAPARSTQGQAIPSCATVAAFLTEQLEAPGRSRDVAVASDPRSPDDPFLASPEEICAAVETTVQHFLQVDGVSVELAPIPAETAVPEHGPKLSARLTFRNTTLGLVRVWRSEGQPGFDGRESKLLRAAANHAAILLAFSRSCSELEDLRRTQVAMSRSERELLLETVAAEVADEVRLPINFFRTIFRRGAAPPVLDVEEVEIGHEEVERLERLATGLRRVTNRRLERQVVDFGSLLRRAQVVLHDELRESKLAVSLDSECVRCDPGLMTHVIAHLLSNAIRAVADGGQIGISWAALDSGGHLTVWDTGPGIEGPPSRLFVPGLTSDSASTGMGLAMVRRIVRAHGWSIDASSAGGRTTFTVSVPASDVAAANALDDVQGA